MNLKNDSTISYVFMVQIQCSELFHIVQILKGQKALGNYKSGTLECVFEHEVILVYWQKV
jgi:hypothetical protein